MEALIVVPITLAEAMPMLERAGTPRADTTGGTATIAELCQGGAAYGVKAGGRLVGAYCLKPVDHESARVLWVQAAGGHLPGRDLTAEVVPAMEVQAAQLGADQLAITTRRRALIGKLLDMGWSVSGVTLRKNL